MIGRGSTACVIALSIAFGGVPRAQAQEWLRLGPLKWEAFVEAEASREKRDDSETFRELDLEEGIRFRQGGAIIDPRIVGFTLEVQPTFGQREVEGPSNVEDRRTTDLNFAGNLGVFNGANLPLSFNANAARTTGDISGSLGSQSDFERLNWDAALNWHNDLFPAVLRYSEDHSEEIFEAGLTDTVTQTEDARRTLSLGARSSKTRASVEREWFDDQSSELDADSTTDRANLSHFLRWGKGSQLNSFVDYFDRRGFNEFRRFDLDETANIQHLENLFSTTSYTFGIFDQETRTVEHQGSFDLSHRLYDSLTTTAGVEGGIADSETSREKTYGGGLDLDYRKQIFWDGQLTAGAGGRYLLTERESEEGFIEVTDEAQVIDPTGSAVLNQRFIDTASVVVTDATGTIVFTRSSDYTLASVGGDRTEIRIVFGGRIGPGDTILVSYRYETLPTTKFSTTTLNYNVGLNFDWISLFHRQSWTDEDLVAGAGESALRDRRTTETGVELSWTGRQTRAAASAARLFGKDDDFETTSLNFRQSLTHRFAPQANVSASVSEIFSKSDDRETDLYNANLSFFWQALPRLLVTPRASVWLRKERPDEPAEADFDEWFASAGIDLRWSWRKLDVDLSYDHERRGGDVVKEKEDRVFLRITRRF